MSTSVALRLVTLIWFHCCLAPGTCRRNGDWANDTSDDREHPKQAWKDLKEFEHNIKLDVHVDHEKDAGVPDDMLG